MTAGDPALRAALAGLERGDGSLLLVAAHPDDDVIGAGALLARVPGARVVYVTDGAPRDGADARAHGFRDVAAYAAARRREAEAALALAGLGADRIARLDVPDQGATFALPAVIGALIELMRAHRPRVVLTHAYEGGHPDHDAVAFAVHEATARLPEAERPMLVEFAGYRAGDGGGRETTFRPCDGCPELVFPLDERQRRAKAAMFACHATQAAVLATFGVEVERFRRAPRYDFTRPPHDGALLYERPGSGAAWGIDGARWRAEVAAVLRG